MKKKLIGKLAALSLAGLTALPTVSIASSALQTTVDHSSNKTTATGNIYFISVTNGQTITGYYDTYDHALTAAQLLGGNASSVTEVALSSFTAVHGSYFTIDNSTGLLTAATSSTPGVIQAVTTTPPTTNPGNVYNGYSYASDTIYHSSVTNRYYPNLEAYLNDPANLAATRNPTPITSPSSYNSVTGYIYFDYTTGYYKNDPNGTVIVIGGYSGTPTTSTGGTVPAGYRYSDSVSYFSYEKQQYYPNLAALYAAVGHSTTNYSIHTLSRPYSSYYCYFDTRTGEYVSTSGAGRVLVNDGTNYYYGYWYSTYTKQYYNSYADALSASQSASQVVYAGYYGNYYDGGYYYGDPYYYFYYYMKNQDNDSSSSSSSSSSGTVTITDSKSWTTLANTIKSAAAGKTISVNMNGNTIIPASVFTALKGKDVTISLKLDSGVVYTINGKNVTSAKDVNILTTYNTNRVPSSLVKKAYQKYNAVSTAQISINSNTFGAKAGVTVKFATKRAGCTARLYRYNSDKRTLSLVDTSTVSSTGKCTFAGVAKGGDFVIILS